MLYIQNMHFYVVFNFDQRGFIQINSFINISHYFEFSSL